MSVLLALEADVWWRDACCHVCSGCVLSLEDPHHGSVSVPRPGPQYDQRRLRFLHVPCNAIKHHWSTMGLLRC